jgi:NDP-sugar pyrophosphorylase family protein
MLNINIFIEDFTTKFRGLENKYPWQITNNLIQIIEELIPQLDDAYAIENGVAIHKSATVESGVVFKSPTIIMENCTVGANAYFREGVILDKSVKIGAGCEIKSSIICSKSAIAHFNYIGNSIIGHDVNFEAGSIAANHYNEREDKEISVKVGGKIIQTHSKKFGALVGDGSKIGANAVLSPGTILEKNSLVKRLELIEQVKHS